MRAGRDLESLKDERPPVKIIISGPPGCGKTTLVQKALDRLRRPVRGFFTKEIREGGKRVGFLIRTVDGTGGLLAHREKKGGVKVGHYWVFLDQVDRVAVQAIVGVAPEELLVIDEIGKMECLSERFREAVREAICGKNDLIATLGKVKDPFFDWVRSHPGVQLLELTPSNRDEALEWLVARLNE